MLCILFLCSGCFYGRYKTEDVEITVVTLGKSVSIDPNGYMSESDKVRLIYPPIIMETK